MGEVFNGLLLIHAMAVVLDAPFAYRSQLILSDNDCYVIGFGINSVPNEFGHPSQGLATDKALEVVFLDVNCNPRHWAPDLARKAIS